MSTINQNSTAKKVRIFICYSSQDAELMLAVLKHLMVLRISKPHLDIWYDGILEPGAKWDEKIKEKLHNAHIVCMLISVDFFLTEYIWNVEVPKTLEREGNDEVSALPIILKPCPWKSTAIGKFNALPRKGKPLSTFSDRETAIDAVIKEIEPIIERWEQKVLLES